MKTKEGRYNEDKVTKAYEQLKDKLNSQELALLTDKLVWDKRITIKTINLIIADLSRGIAV